MSTYKTLPDTGFVRLNSIIAPAGPIPVSKSTWWQGVKDGRFPKPGGARFRPGVPQSYPRRLLSLGRRNRRKRKMSRQPLLLLALASNSTTRLRRLFCFGTANGRMCG